MAEDPSPGGLVSLKIPIDQLFHEPSLSCSKSRSKGINLKTVSPILTSKATFSKRTPLSGLSHSYSHNIKINSKSLLTAEKPLLDPQRLNLPGNANQDPVNISSKLLLKLTIDEQLRLLALKEMSVVELKDTIAALNHKLHHSEKELQKFRQTIQRNLYREMEISAAHHREPKKENLDPVVVNGLASAVQRRSRSRSSTRKQQPKIFRNGESIAPRKQHQHIDPVTNQAKLLSVDREGEPSSLWSNISKPIAFIQNLEGMIQTEMERSLSKRPDEPFGSPQNPIYQRGSHDWTNSELGTGISSYSNTGSFESLKGVLTESIPFKDPELMLQTVSNSLWSFVNEVKQNVMAPNINPDPTTKSDAESGSDCEEEIFEDFSLPTTIRCTRHRINTDSEKVLKSYLAE